MDNDVLVKSIRSICKENGISVSQLEKELNFGAGLISRWVKTDPSLSKIIDIADYFRISIDELIGRNMSYDGAFLNKLYDSTKNSALKWENAKNAKDKNNKIKIYNRLTDEYPPKYYDEDDFTEVSYTSYYEKGYLSLYAFHKYGEIVDPIEIILFIQPTEDSYLVEQKFTSSELLPLWVCILNHLGEDAPDEIKAEEFKNSFVLNKSLTNGNDVLSGGLKNETDIDAIQKILSDPSVMKLMEIYSKPEFQELQKTFLSPEFQKTMQVANKMQKYFEMLSK